MKLIMCFPVDDSQVCRPNVAKRLAGFVNFCFSGVALQSRTCEAGGSIGLWQKGRAHVYAGHSPGPVIPAFASVHDMPTWKTLATESLPEMSLATRHKNQLRNQDHEVPHSEIVNHPRGRGNSITCDAQRMCAVRSLQTTPTPIKFDRQGHSCKFFVGSGRTN